MNIFLEDGKLREFIGQEATKEGIWDPQEGRKYNDKSKNMSKSNRLSSSARVL